MLKKIVQYTLITSLPLSSLVAGPSKIDMCPTDDARPSSAAVRNLAYTYISMQKSLDPHKVTLVNDNDIMGGPTGSTSRRLIYFNETYFSHLPLGCGRVGLAHETVHLSLNHTQLNPPHSAMRKEERVADLVGAKLSSCNTCIVEFAQDLLNRENPDVIDYFKLPRTLTEFEQLNKSHQDICLKLAHSLSVHLDTTHPRYCERAYYLSQLSHQYKGLFCGYHSRGTNDKK